MSDKFLDIEKIIKEKNPSLLKWMPGFMLGYIKRILHQKEVNRIIKDNEDKYGYDFADAMLNEFNIKLEVEGLENIPKEGGVVLNGFYGDHAYTFEVGEVSPDIKKLLRITKESLYKGIAQTRKGKRIGDIGNAIQKHTEAEGYGVVRDLVGHGLGRVMHEDPQVPNYGRPGRGKVIREGLVIAIEPMINMGTHDVRQLPDGWNIISADKSPSAHFEHDVAVVNGKPDILSTFDYIYEALGLPKDKIPA